MDIKDQEKRKIIYPMCETFIEWFDHNRNRFKRECGIRYFPKEKHVRITIKDITPEIQMKLYNHAGLTISVHYRGKHWDTIGDFDCSVMQAEEGGYFCPFCVQPKFYKTWKDLIINNTFEPFLKYVNEYFTPSNFLFLEVNKGSTYAQIIDTGKPAQIEEDIRQNFYTLLAELASKNPKPSLKEDHRIMTLIPVIKGGFHDCKKTAGFQHL
jgi:hypothetical protein